MRVCYVPKAFRAESQRLIAIADGICLDYAAQGFTLTLRQLYYQFVARGIIANKQSEYDRLGVIISDARLAGLLDWDHMEDRTRQVRENSHWGDPGSIINSAARSYHTDLWEEQAEAVEVWIEKDALVGTIIPACTRNDVAYFSCRGYTSQSEMYKAAKRLMGHMDAGKAVTILHLGDHDPSGIDMSRDIRDRLALFCEHDGYDAPQLERLALNYAQVQAYNPPPNPAKLSDSRAEDYIAKYGASCWELDALTPDVLDTLVQNAIEEHRDAAQWDHSRALMEQERQILTKASNLWPRIAFAIENNQL